MKYFKFIPIIALFIFACNTVEDDANDVPAAPVDENGEVISTIEPGMIQSMDSVNFRHLISDSVSKTWNTTLFTLAGSTTFTNCRLDDVMIFFADGTYNYQGGRLCGAEDNQSMRNGNWELSYGEKKIYFDRGSSEQYEAEVIGLEEDELRVKGSYMMMEVRGIYTNN